WREYPAHSFTVDEIRLENGCLPGTKPISVPLATSWLRTRSSKPSSGQASRRVSPRIAAGEVLVLSFALVYSKSIYHSKQWAGEELTMQHASTLSRRSFLGASAAAVGALAVPTAQAASSTRKLVMLAGKPSHGPMEHEFNAGVLLLKKCLAGV